MLTHLHFGCNPCMPCNENYLFTWGMNCDSRAASSGRSLRNHKQFSRRFPSLQIAMGLLGIL
jgi:hypothetical protein